MRIVRRRYCILVGTNLKLTTFTVIIMGIIGCIPTSANASLTLAEGESLVFAVDIVRHGDRNPGKETPNSPYPWIGELNALTDKGVNRKQAIGKALRNEYIEKFYLLPKTYQPGTMLVRSTDTTRTIKSAEALLYGLYPDNLRQNAQIQIFVEKNDKDRLLIVQPDSSIFSIIKVYFWKKSFWSQQIQILEQKLAKLSSLTGLPLNGFDDLDGLADNLHVRLINHVPLPDGIDEATANEIIDLHKKAILSFFELPEVSKPTGMKLLNEINSLFDEAIKQKSSLKYALFSAHDSTIMATLNALGVKVTEIPPFGSRLNFSLLKKGNEFTIQINHDGKPIHSELCGDSSYTLNQWQQLLGLKKPTSPKPRL